MPSIMTAKELGGIQNHLGLLNTNRTTFYPNRLMEITKTNPSEASKKLKVSRPNLYKKEVSIKRDNELARKIIDFVVVGDLVYDLFGGDIEQTIIWLTEPNIDFFGDSPFEICLRGDGKKLIEWLYVKSGKKQGVAF